MLDLRYDSIVYQSQVYVSALVDELITNKRLGKALDSKWAKVDMIIAYLEALEEKDNLQDEDDITDITFILECLIVLCEISSLPTAPTLLWNGTPSILVGIPGPAGAPGTTGSTGTTGLATDFQVSNVSVTSIVDSFPIADAKAARWDYYVSNGSAQRASSILGHWLPDGSLDEMTDDGAEDIGGSTSGIEFDIVYSGGNIQLIATITSGTWTIVGSRYFIPNNGNGSGPVSAVLANGTIFVGNASNTAVSRVVSGAISIDNTGVTTLSSGVIYDANVNVAAAIDTNKLAPLSVSKVVVTTPAGLLTTLETVAISEVEHLSGVSSNLQTQLNGKLIDPLTTIGDLIIRDGTNNTTRLPIGTNGHILTVVAGVAGWAAAPGGISGLTTSYIPKASSATTLTNSIISESTGAITIAGTLEAQGGFRTDATGIYFKKHIMDIGDWDMDTDTDKLITIASTGLDWTKIRHIDVMIRSDDASQYLPLDSSSSGSVNGGVENITSTNISLRRNPGEVFDNTQFNATSYNRGWLIITYST